MSSEATLVVKKRERTQNWVPEEKSALFSLIKMHVNAIENKRIDAAASAMKSLAWQQIFRAFRGRFSTERDITRMREQWRRMKAQARIEMYTFAEKVRTLGPEEASKARPSNLSIEVWRLMENTKKGDGDAAERSDESSQEADGSVNFQGILDKLTVNCPPEMTVHEIKIEATSDGYNEDTVQSYQQQPREQVNQKRKGNDQSSTPKRSKTDRSLRHNLDHGDESDDSFEDTPALPLEPMQREIWMFEAAQKEHNLKLQMLNIELEKAELQRQTAINDLKTSEIKKQLAESQAAEFYSQVRMQGEPGSGAGKGGGGGGAIRSAGGSFGRMEAAHEDQYFYNQTKEQLSKLRDGLKDEISFHEEQIKRHQEAIDRHRNRIVDMEKK